MASSSSSSSAVEVRKHDVFLSFCGEDTRTTFTSTLHGVLESRGINVFVDDELKTGEEISSSLMSAIEESMISVIIFSKGYASSRWCLEELVKIMECKKRKKQVVIPVFYRINPSEVRNQTEIFGDGFSKLVESFDEEKLEKLQMTEEQSKDKIQTWKNALTDAANISGRSTKQRSDDFGLANIVMEDILKFLNFMSPNNNDKKLVGVESIIQKIESLLQIRLGIVHIVGIWGMRGIGKTSIAKSVFDKISNQFEGSYFASNIREESMRPCGLTSMRQELLFTILKHPVGFTKGRLDRKKVLIVFDDVTTIGQVESLIENTNCLGPGSRIIITATDKQVLQNCGADDINIYKMKGLLKNEALQLFSWYAFRQNGPNIDYGDLSNRVVKYTKGVPLAIKVLGCYLLGKSKEVWESALKKFEIIPHRDIHKVLKISYDDLHDDEQRIFLDIACFLKGESKDFVGDFLNACDWEAEIALSVLIDKCLITISEDNKITTHDLLQEMGWEIVRQESIKDPGKRSRLWYHKDIYRVLEKNKISNAIEGICLDMSGQGEIVNLQPSALGVMDQLRFFKLHNTLNEANNINKVHVSHGLNSVATDLRYLCWHGCPLKLLQPNFMPKYLVALDMPHSNIEQLWSSTQLHNLKHIDLSFSKHLRIQDLSLTPNLENLILEGCTSLREIASSIYGLNYKLLILNLRQCKSLGSLPTGIRLESLKKIHFSGCSMLEGVPSNICESKSLEHLNLSGCSKLHGLPDNMGNLEALRVLKAQRVPTRELPTSILNLRCVEELDLTSCGIEELPNNLGQLSTLRSLLLGRNFFKSIPISIVQLSKLSYLDLRYCERLEILPELPSKLANIDASNCTALEAPSKFSVFFFGHITQGIKVNFSNCFKLDRFALGKTIEDFGSSRNIYLFGKTLALSKMASGCICFPGWEIPEWFNFQRIGSFITLEKPANLCSSDLNSLLICVVVEFRNYHNEGEGLVVGFDCVLTRENGIMDLFQGTLGGWDYGNGPDNVDSDHVFLGSDNALKFSGSHSIENHKYCGMTIRFYVENLNIEKLGCCNVKKCGVWGPSLELTTREEKPEAMKVKVEHFYGGESSSREEKPESKKMKIEHFYGGESSSRQNT